MADATASLSLNEAQSILEQLASAFPIVTAVTTPPSLSSVYEETDDQTIPEIDARYQTLVEQIPAVVFMAFLDKGIGEAYVSPQIETLLGFTQEEWLNDPVRWYQQIHPDDKARWSVEAAELFLLGHPLRSFYRVVARNGNVVWFHCEAKMVRNKDGQPWFIHGVAFDISEVKRAEEALAKSEQLLQGLFDFAPDTIAVVDHRGSIVRINAQVEKMFGYTTQELAGLSIETLMPERYRSSHSKQRQGYFIEPHTRPMGAGLALSGKRKDGTEFPVDIMLSPMDSETGNVVIAVIRDITRRRMAEEAQRDYADRLQLLSRRLMEVQELERRKIALELHDEIGQVLTGLKLTLEVGSRLPLTEVNGNLEHARVLVNELMTRVRNLSLDLRPAMLDDFGLLPTLLWHFEHYTAQTHVAVSFKHSGLERRRFPPELETAAYRVVKEALTNVARHSNVASATVRVWTDQRILSIEIEDFGQGFDLNSLSTRETSGLAGMRERTSLLGGQLKIDSRVGEGTRLIAEFNIEEKRVVGAT